jgi:hypothetical protein
LYLQSLAALKGSWSNVWPKWCLNPPENTRTRGEPHLSGTTATL